MRSLIEDLPARIARLEAKHGPNDPFVKDLKEQLRASLATQGKSTQDVYRMQAIPLTQASKPAKSGPKSLPDLQNLPEDPALVAMREMDRALSRPATRGPKPDAEKP